MIGATVTHSSGNPSSSWRPKYSDSFVQTRPSRCQAHERTADSMRFWAASAQSSTIHGPCWQQKSRSAQARDRKYESSDRSVAPQPDRPERSASCLPACGIWLHARFRPEFHGRDDGERPGLLMHGVGCVHRSIDEPMDRLAVDCLGRVLAHRAPAEYCLVDVHFAVLRHDIAHGDVADKTGWRRRAY